MQTLPQHRRGLAVDQHPPLALGAGEDPGVAVGVPHADGGHPHGGLRAVKVRP